MKIVDCKPNEVNLRDNQTDYLNWVEENWNNYDIFVAVKPVASGKSISIITLGKYIGAISRKSTVITHRKILQAQYENEFPGIPILKGSSDFDCDENRFFDKKLKMSVTPSCRRVKDGAGRYCDTCVYKKNTEDCNKAPISIANFYSYYHLGEEKEHLIIDEAHNTLSFLFDFSDNKMWQHEYGYKPEDIVGKDAFVSFIFKQVERLEQEKKLFVAGTRESEEMDEQIQKLKITGSMLANYWEDFIVREKEEFFANTNKPEFRSLVGKKQKYMYIKPLVIKNLAQSMLWPEKTVKKVFLLSATINESDVNKLGLLNKRVGFFNSKSPIDKEKRPVRFIPVAKMTRAARAESMPKIVDAIKRISTKHQKERGVIHVTYEISKELKNYLKDPRYIFHTSKDAKSVYNQFLQCQGNEVLIACGMGEGIDLKDDTARWQIIPMVIWPSLEDDVNAWFSRNEPLYYKWMTARSIQQQVGRVCRNPNDYGITYIIASEFEDLYNATVNSGIWMEWFKESLKKVNPPS